MSRPAKSFHSHDYSYPYVIWVENVRASGLLLTVLAPKRRLFSRTRIPKIVHTEPTVYYSTPDQESEYTLDLISAGSEHVPPTSQYRVALSLPEVHEILYHTWGLALPHGYHPRYPGRRAT